MASSTSMPRYRVADSPAARGPPAAVSASHTPANQRSLTRCVVARAMCSITREPIFRTSHGWWSMASGTGEGPLGHSDVVIDGQLAVWAEANAPITATAPTHVHAIVRFDLLRSRLHILLRSHAEGACGSGPDEKCCGEQSTFQHAIERSHARSIQRQRSQLTSVGWRPVSPLPRVRCSAARPQSADMDRGVVHRGDRGRNNFR